jgi:hypothetical protein
MYDVRSCLCIQKAWRSSNWIVLLTGVAAGMLDSQQIITLPVRAAQNVLWIQKHIIDTVNKAKILCLVSWGVITVQFVNHAATFRRKSLTPSSS